MIMKKTNISLLVLSALSTGAWAQQNAASILNNPPTTVEIVGQGYREDIKPSSSRNPFRMAESSSLQTQIITREEIENLRPSNAFELLNNATGVLATEGSRKGFSNLNIRGDNNFIWIIDGAYMLPSVASRLMKSIPVMAIDEVQVVRGGTALTLGPMTGSISPGGAPVDGFVVVRTRKPKGQEAQVRLAVETNDTVQTGAWLARKVGEPENKAYVAGLINYSDTNGPKDKLDNGASYNAWRESTSGLVKSGFEANGWTVDLMGYKDDGEFGVPNANNHFRTGAGTVQSPYAYGSTGSWRVAPSQTDMFVLNASKGWSSTQTTLLSLSNTQSHQVLQSPGSALNDNDITHLNLRQHMDFGKTRVALGGDFLHWKNPSGMNYFEGIKREEETTGLFATIEQKLLDDRLTLDAGLRRDQVKVLHGLDYYTAGAQPPGGTSSPLIYQDRTLPSAEFKSLGASYKLNAVWKATARYSTANQVSRNLNPMTGVTLGDDEQKKWEMGFAGAINTWFNPSINFFSREVKNEKSVKGFTYTNANNAIVAGTTCAARVATTGVNSVKWNGTSDIAECYGQDDTLRQGVELVSNGRMSESGSYRFGWTHFTKLDRVELTTPKNIVDFSMSQDLSVYKLTGSVKRVSSYRASTSDANDFLGGYYRVDFGVGRNIRLSDVDTRITTYVRNLTDKRYETTNGIQDVGRMFGVEMIAKF
jgi:iron complex outermembrane receptor protein